MTGSGYANVSTYASNLQYRAWGALKGMTYGNNLALSAGYIKAAYSGSEARDYLSGTTSGFVIGPYHQTYQLNVWNELTSRTNRFWSQQDNFTASYSNGLNQNPQWQYDSSGNVLQDESLHYTWDAAGHSREVRNLNRTRIITQE